MRMSVVGVEEVECQRLPPNNLQNKNHKSFFCESLLFDEKSVNFSHEKAHQIIFHYQILFIRFRSAYLSFELSSSIRIYKLIFISCSFNDSFSEFQNWISVTLS